MNSLVKMRLAGILAGVAAFFFTAAQLPRFLVLAATQPGKITVTVPVLVTDAADRIVSQLQEEHFKLYEDQTEQKITGFNDKSDESDESILVVVNGVTQDPTTA
jgi:hypothetical protein